MIRRSLLIATLLVVSLANAPVSGICCLQESFVPGRLLVTFTEGTTEETVHRIAAETDTEVIRFLSSWLGGETYIMQVPVEQELTYEVLFEARPDVVRASTDGFSCPELTHCTCCPWGQVCPELEPCFTLRPVVIALDRSSQSREITIRWQPECVHGDETDYAIYEGAIGDFGSHLRVTCHDAGPTMEEPIVPSEGDRYYLVVPEDFVFEGSHGTDSRSLERARGPSVCNSNQTFTPCPL